MPAAINPPVVLVLGASGLLGRAVQHTLLESLPHGVVVAGTGHSRARGLIPCDVTDETTLREFLAAQAPRVVVNCVAERRPDVVEKEDAKAHVLNVRLVEILAEESARLGFYLLHISTDYVFDGTKPPYKPGDDPHPLNAYGEQKLASEKVLRGKDSGERVRPGQGSREEKQGGWDKVWTEGTRIESSITRHAKEPLLTQPVPVFRSLCECLALRPAPSSVSQSSTAQAPIWLSLPSRSSHATSSCPRGPRRRRWTIGLLGTPRTRRTWPA